MSDKAIADKISEYFPASHYSLVLQEDADVWGVDDNGKREKLLVKFRKGVIRIVFTKLGIGNLKESI